MKNKLSKILFLFLLFSLFIVISATADDENIFNTYDNALGGFFGPIAGSGLSHQHWFGKVGFQYAAGLFYYPEEQELYAISPYYTADPVNVDEFTYNIGVEVQYMLYEDSYGDWFDGCLYLFLGGMHIGVMRTTYYYEEVTVNPEDGSPYKEYRNTSVSEPVYVPGLAGGLGFGFELVFFDHFSVPFEIGIGGTWEFGSIMPVDAGLNPQAGIRYRF